jgi:putative endonuclease
LVERGWRREAGDRGEALAAQELTRLGFQILARNYACRWGEVDLVADEGGCLCFVEVRSRSAGSAVAPVETVNRRKQRRIVAAAKHYLARIGEPRAVRFDVASVVLADRGLDRVELLRNAFDAGE